MNTGFVLNGKEKWFYEDGTLQYEADFEKGNIIGTESYWGKDGKLQWQRNHTLYGINIYTRFWPNGKKKSKSTWQGLMAEGVAQMWDSSGNLIQERMFENGKIMPE